MLYDLQELHIYNADEVDLNEKLHHFAEHCAEYLKGQNTQYAQLGLNTRAAKTTGMLRYFEFNMTFKEFFQYYSGPDPPLK